MHAKLGCAIVDGIYKNLHDVPESTSYRVYFSVSFWHGRVPLFVFCPFAKLASNLVVRQVLDWLKHGKFKARTDPNLILCWILGKGYRYGMY